MTASGVRRKSHVRPKERRTWDNAGEEVPPATVLEGDYFLGGGGAVCCSLLGGTMFFMRM